MHDQPSRTTLLHQPCIEPHALQEEDQTGKTEEEEEDEGIEAQPDEGGSREAGEEVVTLEQCLAWGGEQRQRCRLTMSVSGDSCTQTSNACLLLTHSPAFSVTLHINFLIWYGTHQLSSLQAHYEQGCTHSPVALWLREHRQCTSSMPPHLWPEQSH